MANIIKGKELADKIVEQVRQEASSMPSRPTLAVIIVGNDPASKIYVNKKKETAQRAGIHSFVIEMPESIFQNQLLQKIDELNNDRNINGILVQLPLPSHINTFDIIGRIRPDKDVDGFHPINVGMLAVGMTPYALPCTPAGILALLEDNNIDIESKNAVIIGRSNIVGKPLSYMLLQKNATVTVCHSKTQNIQQIVQNADIVVSAAGKAKFVNWEWVREGAVVIDVGMNRDEHGKLCGDIDFESVEPRASYITPVPGGVGPMTIAMLLKNTLNLYKINKR